MDFNQDEIETPATPFGQLIADYVSTFFTPHRMAFFVIFAACLIANVVLPQFLSLSYLPRVCGFFLGGLSTEIFLLAVYGALAPGRSWDSTIISSLMLLLAYASYVLGLQPFKPVPVEVVTGIFIVAIAGYLITFVELCLMRRFIGVHVGPKHEASVDQPQQRVTIIYLMSLTTVVAIGYCVLRWTIPDHSEGLPGSMLSIAFAGAVLTLFCQAIAVLALVLVLRSGLDAFWMLVVLVAIEMGVWGSCWLLPYASRQFAGGALPLAFAFVIGHTTFCLLGLLVIRALGYRAKWSR